MLIIFRRKYSLGFCHAFHLYSKFNIPELKVKKKKHVNSAQFPPMFESNTSCTHFLSHKITHTVMKHVATFEFVKNVLKA